MMRERQERKTKQTKKNKTRQTNADRVHEAAIPAASSQLAQGDNIKSVHDVI